MGRNHGSRRERSGLFLRLSMPPRSWLVLVFYSLLLPLVMAMSMMIGHKRRVQRCGGLVSITTAKTMSQVPFCHTAPRADSQSSARLTSRITRRLNPSRLVSPYSSQPVIRRCAVAAVMLPPNNPHPHPLPCSRQTDV
ncbi:uncharacterized protein IWZ02DRAFT_54719 [Phyllosticta citriasiana]|uniref:Uncharacterized protein n=1 Tax=Phyllosticta citriasiana TaxID=595635 RepID=A0ABR1L0N6_9PEZI